MTSRTYIVQTTFEMILALVRARADIMEAIANTGAARITVEAIRPKPALCAVSNLPKLRPPELAAVARNRE